MATHPKSPNPLEDLVDTEKEYVADLKILLQVPFQSFDLSKVLSTFSISC